MLLFLTAQADGIYGSMITEDVPTFRITLPGGETAYGAVQIGGEWVKDAMPARPTSKVEIFFDEPWRFDEQARQRVMISSLADYAFSLERPVLRTERLKKGWEEAGYQLVRGPNQELLPVPKEEVKLAGEARKMVQEMEKSMNAPGPGNTGSGQGAVESLSFFEQWKAHIVISAFGLLVIGIILKAFVLENSEGN